MSTLSFSDEGASDEVLLNTVGKFSPQFETRIATDQNIVCEMGSVGEIQARGECVLRKYWAAPDATSAAFTIDGWLKTGDLALLREDENVVLKGRVHEMIKTGGYNVYPRDVEQILEVHPAVAEAVVFGLPDDLYGERVCAVIELSAVCAGKLDSQRLKVYCQGKITDYQILREFRLCATLPRLSNGKLDRNAIGRNMSRL